MPSNWIKSQDPWRFFKKSFNKDAIPIGFAFFTKALGAACAYLMQVAAARTLGAENSSEFFIAFTLVIVVSALSRLGLDNIITRHIAEAAEKKDAASVSEFYISSLLIVTVASVFCGLLCLYFHHEIAYFVSKQGSGYLESACIAIAALFSSLYVVGAQVLQGLHRANSSIFVTAVANNLALFFAFLILPIHGDPKGALLLLPASAALVATISVIMVAPELRSGLRAGGLVVATSAIRSLLDKSISLTLIAALNLIQNWGPILIVGYLATKQETALFAAASRTSAVISFILLSSAAYAAPKIASLYSQGRLEELQHLTRRISVITTIAAAPLLALICAFSEQLMGVFGPEFSAGWLILILLSIGQFANAVTGLGAITLLMSRQERPFLAVQFIAATLLLIALPIATIRYGVVGGAVATAVVMAIQNVLCVVAVRRATGLSVSFLLAGRKH